MEASFVLTRFFTLLLLNLFAPSTPNFHLTCVEFVLTPDSASYSALTFLKIMFLPLKSFASKARIQKAEYLAPHFFPSLHCFYLILFSLFTHLFLANRSRDVFYVSQY